MTFESEKPRSLKEVIQEESTEVLETYMLALSKYPVLERREERHLATKLKQGRQKLIELFVSSNAAMTALYLLLEESTVPDLRKVFSKKVDPETTKEDVEQFAEELKEIIQASLSGNTTKKELKAYLNEVSLSLTTMEPIFESIRETEPTDKIQKMESLIQESLKAKNRLVECNLKLVFSRAKRFIDQGLDIEDLLQEGNMGLVRAIEKFDPDRGLKLSTYATHWIEQAFRRALDNQSRLIRVPVHLLEDFHKMKKAVRELYQEKGRDPTDSEIATYLEISESRVETIRDITRTPIDLDQTMGFEGDPLKDFIKDENQLDPLTQYQQSQLRDTLKTVLSQLTPTEEKVLRMRFGIGEETHCHTLESIGNTFGRTKERIRQIESAGLAKIRKKIKRFKGTEDAKKILSAYF